MNFLNNLKTDTKLKLVNIVNIIALLFIVGVVFFETTKLKEDSKHIEEISHLSCAISDTTEAGLQIIAAIRMVIIDPSDSKAKANAINAIANIEEKINALKKYEDISNGFNSFKVDDLYGAYKNILQEANKKLSNNQIIDKKYIVQTTSVWRPLKSSLKQWRAENSKKTAFYEEEFSQAVSFLVTSVVSTIIISLVFISSLIFFVSRSITTSLKSFKNGLDGFFSFIKRETLQSTYIDIKGKDEFAEMANDVNDLISSTVKEIQLDNNLIQEIDDVIEKINNGFFYYTVKGESTNPLTMSMRDKVNELAVCTNDQMQLVVEALVKYGESDFTFTYDKEKYKEMNGAFGSLLAATMLIGNNVSELISMILNAGEKLDKDTDILTETSSNLSRASNEQAASLEETAAALEEITSTIISNNESITRILDNSKELTYSVNDGQTLANKTAVSMDEINTQVNAISDAITVIDKIAFQTNILSLNAAVEAATAGEAGKGFAVVAGEVRNLAARSAEAANEIKSLVENATSKANEGKKISDDMITGYNKLNSNIQGTITLIDDIASASREQEAGIGQINDAVAMLDQETQRNAMEASRISDLVGEVSDLSNNLVLAANRANFKQDARKQVDDVELVFTTAKLKNDHIRFKETNFKKLNSIKVEPVVDHHSCNLGKWIDEQSRLGKVFTKSSSWAQFLKYHETVHNKVREYMNKSAQKVENSELKRISQEIEHATIGVFNGLNQVKIENGKLLNADEIAKIDHIQNETASQLKNIS